MPMAGGGNAKRITIVGGYGKMGRWFARWLREAGHQVTITGRDESKVRRTANELGITAGQAGAIAEAEIVIIAVPPDAFEDAAREIGPGVRPGQKIFDITSIKAKPVASMHRHLRGPLVLGTHPMFGPGAQDVSRHNFILTPTNDAETGLANKVKAYLEELGAHVFVMSPEEHDRLIATVLGLTHFIALVSADTLLSYDNLPMTQVVSSSTYKVLLTLMAGTLSDTPALTAALQLDVNTEGVAAVFRQKADEWAGRLAERDRDGLIESIEDLQKRMAREGFDFKQMYERMYRIVEGF